MQRARIIYILGRLVQMLVLWVIVTILFLIFRLMPGNPLIGLHRSRRSPRSRRRGSPSVRSGPTAARAVRPLPAQHRHRESRHLLLPEGAGVRDPDGRLPEHAAADWNLARSSPTSSASSAAPFSPGGAARCSRGRHPRGPDDPGRAGVFRRHAGPLRSSRSTCGWFPSSGVSRSRGDLRLGLRAADLAPISGTTWPCRR